MTERFTPGRPTFLASDSPSQPYSTVFEDDGETGYFYAWDQSQAEGQILDAIHVYDVASVVDKHLESEVEIVWAGDGLKSVLLINGPSRAVFDFAAKRA